MSEDRLPQRPYPTLRSILQPEALADSVRAAYRLDVTGCSLLKSQLSDIYRIDSQSGPFILRVYPHGLNLAKWVHAEVMILRALNEKDVPVSLPLPLAGGPLPEAGGPLPEAGRPLPNGPEPLAGGEWLLPLDAPEGERYAVLFTYARGWSLKRAKDPALFHTFGRVTALMHHAAGVLPHSLARVPLDSYSLLARPLEIIGLAYPERAEEVEELREVARLAQQVFELLPPAAWGFCHGDLNFSNVHVSQEGDFTLFHFEYCGPGWPVYDIATLMNFESRDAAHLFLQGYEEERPLAPQERAALGWFQIANRLWMLGTAASMSSVFGSLLTSSLLFDQTLEFVRERIENLIDH